MKLTSDTAVMAANDNRQGVASLLPVMEWESAEPIGKAAERLLRTLIARKGGR